MAIDTTQRTSDAVEDVAHVVARLREQGVDVVRVSYPDLIGVDRGRDVLVDELERVAGHGLAFCRAVFHTSPMGDVVPVPGGLDAGLPDISVTPDLSTLTPLPWEPGAAWCVGDTWGHDGTPAAEAPREVARRVSRRLAELGLTAVVGPELEFFVCEQDAQRRVAPVRRRARQRVRGRAQGRPARPARHDAAPPARRRPAGDRREPRVLPRPVRDQPRPLRARRLRGPGVPPQVRRPGDRPAPRPAGDLHGQAVQRRGWQRLPPARVPRRRARAPTSSATSPARRGCPSAAAPRSPASSRTRRRLPPCSTRRSTPTSGSAPTPSPRGSIDWGLDNRSAMVRIPPERGSASRMEVRLGDATANPYLAAAAVGAAVYLGVRDGLEPPEPLEGYGYDPSKAQLLPQRLPDALDALEADTALRDVLGEHVRDVVPDLQAQRGRAVRAARDRLGVPRVRLPPLTRHSPRDDQGKVRPTCPGARRRDGALFLDRRRRETGP